MIDQFCLPGAQRQEPLESDKSGNVLETHEHKGEFKEPGSDERFIRSPRLFPRAPTRAREKALTWLNSTVSVCADRQTI